MRDFQLFHKLIYAYFVMSSDTGNQNEWQRARSTNGFEYSHSALKTKLQEYFSML